MGVSLNGGNPKSSILIGVSIIFTIHFGGKSPYFWKRPYDAPFFFSQPANPSGDAQNYSGNAKVGSTWNASGLGKISGSWSDDE